MVYEICAVFDSAVNCYARPVFVASVRVAVRQFQDEVNRVSEDNPMNRHPEDFSLYHLGTFEDEGGYIARLEKPERIARASDFFNEKG